MTIYFANDNDLIEVADSIRGIRRISNSLEFPSEFVDAIESVTYSPNNLPGEYTELKYIASSGTQYINTGIVGTLETEIEITYQANSLTQGAYAVVIGSMNPTMFLQLVGSGFGTIISAGTSESFGNKQAISDGMNPFGIGIKKLNKTECLMNYINSGAPDYSKAMGATSISSGNDNICVCARQNGSSIERFARINVYDVKISTNGVIQAHLVPSRRDSDQVIGMYDMIRNEFYQNSGTGAFIAGEY